MGPPRPDLLPAPAAPSEPGSAPPSGDGASGHLGDERIDRLLAATLSPEETLAAQQHLDACEGCRTRRRTVVNALERAQLDAHARQRAAAEAEANRRKREVASTTSLWGLMVLGAAVAAVAWMGGLSRSAFGTFGTTVPSPTVEVRRATSGQLTVSVQGRGATYLLLFTRLPGGAWTSTWPREGVVSGPLASRGHTAPDLPAGAAELVAVFSRTPLSGPVVLEALQQNPALKQLPGAWVVRVPVDAEN
jgi:hypothetical protein